MLVQLMYIGYGLLVGKAQKWGITPTGVLYFKTGVCHVS